MFSLDSKFRQIYPFKFTFESRIKPLGVESDNGHVTIHYYIDSGNKQPIEKWLDKLSQDSNKVYVPDSNFQSYEDYLQSLEDDTYTLGGNIRESPYYERRKGKWYKVT